MRIVITEASVPENVGSMALIENAVKIARNIDKECEITILAASKEGVTSTLSKKYPMNNINVIGDFFLFPDKCGKIKNLMWGAIMLLLIVYLRILLVFTKKPYKYIWGRRKQLLKCVCDSDYVFCIGAERINDIYYKTAYLSLEALDIFEKVGAKLIHFSLTIGPVFNKSTIRKASKVLNNSYGIFVRDQKSIDLLNELNVTQPKIFNSYDIVILQDLPKENDCEELHTKLNLPSNYVCASVIHWRFRKCEGPTRLEEYYRSFAETLDYVVEKYNIDVVVTPTVVGRYWIDDVSAGRSMYEYIKNKNRVHLIEILLTPSELSFVFSKSKFSIVTRMHAAILCTAAGNRPIISINYLYKLREYMKNIGFENYSIDIDYCNAKDLKNFVDMMVDNYEDNCLKLEKKISEMRTKLKTDIATINLD